MGGWIDVIQKDGWMDKWVEVVLRDGWTMC